jgi:hypothetical protein
MMLLGILKLPESVTRVSPGCKHRCIASAELHCFVLETQFSHFGGLVRPDLGAAFNPQVQQG